MTGGRAAQPRVPGTTGGRGVAGVRGMNALPMRVRSSELVPWLYVLCVLCVLCVVAAAPRAWAQQAPATQSTDPPATVSSPEATGTGTVADVAIWHQHAVGDDVLEMLRLSGVGFVHQFTYWQAGVLWGAGAAVTSLGFVGDVDAWQLDIEREDLVGRGGEQVGDVGGLLLGVGLVNVGAYVAGRAFDDERAIHFALELSAVQVIANLETLAISQFPVHERPVEARGEISRDDQPFFNVIRGRSSFPSGHVVGPAALAVKGWEFYGWPLGVPATLAALFVGYARVQEGQHYLTDILGGYALVAVASWAVSSARTPFSCGGMRWVPYAGRSGGGLRAVGTF